MFVEIERRFFWVVFDFGRCEFEVIFSFFAVLCALCKRFNVFSLERLVGWFCFGFWFNFSDFFWRFL